MASRSSTMTACRAAPTRARQGRAGHAAQIVRRRPRGCGPIARRAFRNPNPPGAERIATVHIDDRGSDAEVTEKAARSADRRRMTRGRCKRSTVLAGLCLTIGLTRTSAQVQPAQQIANPASQNCVARGGMLRIESRPDGGQYGVCIFEDNRQCEEWAMFRGAVPGGRLARDRLHNGGRALLRHHGRTLHRDCQQRHRRRAGRLLAAGRQGLCRGRVLCRHLRPVTADEPAVGIALGTCVTTERVHKRTCRSRMENGRRMIP